MPSGPTEDPEPARQVRGVAVLLIERCLGRQRDGSSRSCFGGCARGGKSDDTEVRLVAQVDARVEFRLLTPLPLDLNLRERRHSILEKSEGGEVPHGDVRWL